MFTTMPNPWIPEEGDVFVPVPGSAAEPVPDIPRITRESEMARLGIRIQSVVDGVNVYNNSPLTADEPRPAFDVVPPRKKRGRPKKVEAVVEEEEVLDIIEDIADNTEEDD